ncbi:AgrD family cyclic lactone autoinducer peptide [Bacillus solitudinis]|nr:cyclic lactone autoinducer peptide [Bacillus solitudinis]
MKKTAKALSKVTAGISTVFVNASSPLIHAPNVPESLKKAK